MSNLRQLHAELLQDGKITPTEVERIRQHVHQDGRLDLEDVKFLVDLLSEAREVCSAFYDLIFPVLRDVLLDDGRIDTAEQFYLMKMLYSDGHVRASEKEFLRQLRKELQEANPAFDALCEEAFAAHPTHWDVGGRR